MLEKWDTMVASAAALPDKKQKIQFMKKTFGGLFPYWFLKGVTRPRIPEWCSSRVIPRKPAQVAPSYFDQVYEFTEDPTVIAGDLPGYFQFQPAHPDTDAIAKDAIQRSGQGSIVTHLRDSGPMVFFAYYRVVTKGHHHAMALEGMVRKTDRHLLDNENLNLFRSPGLRPYKAKVLWVDRMHRFVILACREKALLRHFTQK